MCDNGVWLEAHNVNRGAREPMCRNRSQNNILRLQSVLSYLSGIKNTTIRKTLTGRRRRRRRRRARNHGDGWVPKGKHSSWKHIMWAPERQCARTTTERRFISIRIGSVSYLITYNNNINTHRSRREWGTMVEDGFPQELQLNERQPG